MASCDFVVVEADGSEADIDGRKAWMAGCMNFVGYFDDDGGLDLADVHSCLALANDPRRETHHDIVADDIVGGWNIRNCSGLALEPGIVWSDALCPSQNHLMVVHTPFGCDQSH